MCLLEHVPYAQVVFFDVFFGQKLDLLPPKNNMSPENIVIGRLFFVDMWVLGGNILFG